MEAKSMTAMLNSYYDNDYIIRVSRYQDDVLKIRARMMLRAIVVGQIPRGCVWNLQKKGNRMSISLVDLKAQYQSIKPK